MSTPVLSKIATAIPARDRLRREAIALRRATHPGVARLSSFTDLADRTELCIERCGDATLLTTVPPDGPSAVACAAALAATLSDLHQLGVAHGRLSADHVVIAPGGRPVLCGFADADGAAITSDIRAFGTLLELLATGVPTPEERRNRRAIATLLTVAERARTGEPAPAAADLARQLGAAPPRARRPLVVPATAVAALVITALGASALTGDEGLPPAIAAPTSVTTAPPMTDPPPTTEPPPPPAARLEVGGAVYQAGRVGDVVVTGDWSCDGVVRAALLRPESGVVYLFDLPTAVGEPRPGRPFATVLGATALTTIDQPDGCTSLVAQRADGSTQVLAAGAR